MPPRTTWVVPLVLAVLAATGSVRADETRFFEKRYRGFAVWLDCRHGGAVLVHYELGPDTGQRARTPYALDPSVPPRCSPASTATYQSVIPDGADALGDWDIGHVLPANHADGDAGMMADANFVTNTLPQAARFNRHGAWAHTEELSECYREIETLRIWAGVVWGSDTSNDHFRLSHGVTTPDYWWKLIHRPRAGTYVAWLMANSPDSTDDDMDRYLVAGATLKSRLALAPDFGPLEDLPAFRERPAASWPYGRTTGGDLRCEGVTADPG